MYKERLKTSEYTANVAFAAAFDAIWTIAQALNYTEKMRENDTDGDLELSNCGSDLAGELVPLDEFDYSNAFMGCVIRYNFHRVNFLGVSVSSVSLNLSPTV